MQQPEFETDQFKVLVTTSGIGSRLGNLTDYTNKSLIPIGSKLALSHIIESYPEDIVFVVTLGHFGNHVREFLTITYPNREFEYVDIQPFQGPGSSLAYSILQAEQNLQMPFIFHACDTLIINEKIPIPNSNWVGGYRAKDATNYASYNVSGSFIPSIHDKGMTEFDYLHIGLVGIKDYLHFWKELKSLILNSPTNNSLSDVNVIQALIRNNIKFISVEFKNWIDIGNSNSLVSGRQKLGYDGSILEKTTESVSFVKNSVIKFFADSKIVDDRISRSTHLGELIPKIEAKTKNFFRYSYESGIPLSYSKNPQKFSHLLEWSSEKLWIHPSYNNKASSEFTNICKHFYLNKTKERVKTFLDKKGMEDKGAIINESFIPPLEELLCEVESILLNNCIKTGFHGDFILDNIIITQDSFKLIDWRQNFGGLIEHGDMYYDISKLNHSLYVNHDIVNKNLYFVDDNNLQVECGILRRDVHVIMEGKLHSFINSHELNLQKVKALTAIIWLNMSPLHHHPFDKFLYYYGKLNLWRALNGIW